MAKFMKVTNHQANPMDLSHLDQVVEARPIELHYNTNGSVEDKPSFAMVSQLQSNLKVCCQFSLNTLEKCLLELGYILTRTA